LHAKVTKQRWRAVCEPQQQQQQQLPAHLICLAGHCHAETAPEPANRLTLLLLLLLLLIAWLGTLAHPAGLWLLLLL
jgi:hypothetical protein